MLDLKGINAGYGSFQALFDISLTVNAGEAVSVIGPNGAGKTTLMRVISGMTAPFSGEMEMEGKSLSSFPPHQIVELGIAHVPENRRLFPGMTVEDNLKLGAFAKTARGDSAKNLEFVYELFPRMKERRSQLAGTMSGGEQQMCAIGRAIMSGPKLLLMDEPSAGLAPVVVQLVLVHPFLIQFKRFPRISMGLGPQIIRRGLVGETHGYLFRCTRGRPTTTRH